MVVLHLSRIEVVLNKHPELWYILSSGSKILKFFFFLQYIRFDLFCFEKKKHFIKSVIC
jgi:hypothetical protein